MDFTHSPRARELLARLQGFLEGHVQPNEMRYHEQVSEAGRWGEVPLLGQLQALARDAGLWNLFLPEGAALIELLNLANANQYYANHCRWARRRYGKWQNTDAAREERALDPLTREPVDPFRNHMRVKVDEVVQVAVGVLNEPNQDVVT